MCVVCWLRISQGLSAITGRIFKRNVILFEAIVHFMFFVSVMQVTKTDFFSFIA